MALFAFDLILYFFLIKKKEDPGRYGGNPVVLFLSAIILLDALEPFLKVLIDTCG